MFADLLLVCHAPTAAVRAASFPSDEPIDARGRTAAEAVVLPTADHAWAAPSAAARQTATSLGLDAAVEPALRDCDFGRWAGRRLVDVGREEPDAVAAWMADITAAPHGGESFDDVIARVGIWLDTRRAVPGVTVAVTHASVIRAAIVNAVAASPGSFWHFEVGSLSRTRLRTDGTRWMLRELRS